MTFVSVILRNELSEIKRLHRVVAQFGEDQELPRTLINNMKVALEEIVSNVIEHGYDDCDHHSIVIQISVQERQVIAEIQDDGRPFNPLSAPVPDLASSLGDRPIGGLGIHLVRRLTDTFDYAFKEGKNCVRIGKHLWKE